MNRKTTDCIHCMTLLCLLLLLSSCSKSIIGKYVGNLDFNERYTSYASLELKKDNTFVLRNETTTVETMNASSFVTETYGTYKIKFNQLEIISEKARDGEISYRLDELKSYRVLYSDTSIPQDTYKITNMIVPVDTVFGDFQIFQNEHRTKFKKSKSNNSIYFMNQSAVFSKKIEPKNSGELQLDCPRLFEVNRAPVQSYD